MESSSRTPEGQPNHCPLCGKDLRIDPSRPPGDAPCPHCGHLLWFRDVEESRPGANPERLQGLFRRANELMVREDYHYAAELLLACVRADRSNFSYVQSFLESLKKRYGNDVRGIAHSRFSGLKARTAVKQAVNKENWEEVILSGLQVLMVNPWDTPTLKAMATASERMREYGPGIAYLKTALEYDTKDPEVNRQLSVALARLENHDAGGQED